MTKKRQSKVRTEETAAEICRRLAEGESLKTIVKDKHMPSEAEVYRWLHDDPAFREQYGRARESQAEHYLEEIIEIADNSTDDVIFLVSEDYDGEGGKPAIKHSAINRARLQIDTRKWAMSKLAPKKYGDKVQTVLTGADGGAVEYRNAEPSKEEVLAKLAEYGIAPQIYEK